MDDDKANGTEWSFTLKLAKPVQAYGKDVTEIVLRKPTGMDYITYGNPLITDYDEPQKIVWDHRKLVPLLAALATVPDVTILALEPQDITSLGFGILRFFLPRPGETRGQA